MPRSKDPRRYNDSYADVLVRMLDKVQIITIDCGERKAAENFRLHLYGYAHAWKSEAFRYIKFDPVQSAQSQEKYEAMARYQITLIGNTVICTHNSQINNVKIESHGAVESDMFDPPAAPTTEISDLTKAPLPVMNDAMQEFENIALASQARTAEAKRKNREEQQVPEHPELKLTTHPRAYSFERPKTNSLGSGSSFPDSSSIHSSETPTGVPDAPSVSPESGEDPSPDSKANDG